MRGSVFMWALSAFVLAACLCGCGGASAVPSISNLCGGRVVESGFLVGTAPPGLAVEVSLDGGAFEPAAGECDWSLRLPSGSATWRRGSQHSVAIRVRTASGEVSDPESWTVEKGQNRDIDGDGFADMAVGAPNANQHLGRVYFLLSGAGALGSSIGQAPADRYLEGTIENNAFGASVAVGDFDGDGRADIAILEGGGGYGHRLHAYSAASFPVTPPFGALATSATVTLPPGAAFGPLCAADFDSDGYDDLAVACSDGGVYPVLSSGPSGLGTQVIDEATATTWYSAGSLAAADLDGDGLVELVAGYLSSAQGLGSFAVYRFSGAGGGSFVEAYSILGPNDLNTGFGITVALADLDGDGLDEIAMGAPGYDGTEEAEPDVGIVYVFSWAGGSRGPPRPGVGTANYSIKGESAGDGFGSALAAFDADGDGRADLAISAPGRNGSAGETYFFLSSARETGVEIAASTAEARFAGVLANRRAGTPAKALRIQGGTNLVVLGVRPLDEAPYGGLIALECRASPPYLSEAAWRWTGPSVLDGWINALE